MKKIWMMSILGIVMMTGCSLEEARNTGAACSPTLTADGYVSIGDLRCYADHVEGMCIDDDGICIHDAKCCGCDAELEECGRYQADFDRLAANAASGDRRYVTSVNGSDDLLPYASLVTDGNLNVCPQEAPHCVWEEDGNGLKFGCIECSKSICGTECVDLQVNMNHCGACGHVCRGAAVCMNGECEALCSKDQTVCHDENDNPFCAVTSADMKNCGMCGHVCNKDIIASSADVACRGGQCEATACIGGYHVFDGKCEADSVENCGAHGLSCNVANADNTCELSTCQFTCRAGTHRYENRCEADSAEHCGEHGKKCETADADNFCTDRGCDFTCHSGYHEYNGGCEKDSAEHCKSHGHACADHIANGYPVCGDTGCSYECNVMYHNYNGSCEENSSGNCGAHGRACTTDMVPHSLFVLCLSGECEAVACDPGYEERSGRCEEVVI